MNMQRRPRTLIFASLCLLLMVVSIARAAALKPMATLSGLVVDPEGKAVVDARVWVDIYNFGNFTKKPVVETRTDKEGRFQVGPFDPFHEHSFTYALQVEAPEFAQTTIDGEFLPMFPAFESNLGKIKLDRGRVFTGRVVDQSGKPMPGVSVSQEMINYYQGHTVLPMGVDYSQITDSDGRYRTPPLPVGVAWVKPRGFENVLEDLRVKPGSVETLKDIVLKKDVVIRGIVKNLQGKPLAGVLLRYGGKDGKVISDKNGRFELHGFGEDAELGLNVSAAEYVPVTGEIQRKRDGLHVRLAEFGEDDEKIKPLPPVQELSLTLRPAGAIEGTVVDADTGEPVRLESVVVCTFERKPNGEIVLNGCRADTEQKTPGKFRASYFFPTEYHLTFTAEGYHDGEAFTPNVTELKPIVGIVAKMKKKQAGSTATLATPSISGKATRGGKPVKVGIAELWVLRGPINAVNASVLRGRMVEAGGVKQLSVPIQDGLYKLAVPHQAAGWYVVVKEPGQALTQVGPFSISNKEQKTVDIACVTGGHIRGKVKGLPAAWEGHGWVVAFNKTGVRSLGRVTLDGTFTISNLPPGEFGLKAGYEGYQDAEVFPGVNENTPENYKVVANPWKQANVVKVESGKEAAGVEIDWPK